ncbi:uncharacterized protein BDR25DRAFT_367653 [Lindgomyces ingoldianus]|uniref:Uncharacterized protein n=1 Tax=Lindgomyces ingoldianus TaxID=673940 RepID=A0ACB6QXS6_9PLEO|nr:uncharacterized protein BDR25DRAFT_367653 [Lindgomyces ingoldianus]KAF2471794.1 hypothetical protein BDR25DRAFT_367653 [Lindgomyces ingoldianus]
MRASGWTILSAILILLIGLPLVRKLPDAGTFPSTLSIFFGGVFFLPLCRRLLSRISRIGASEPHHGSSSSVYGLDHGRLNLTLPPPMWMNMGYWHSNHAGYIPKTLPAASIALLEEVFKTAGFPLLQEVAHQRMPTRILIDLGFGCGDQTLYLMDDFPVQHPDKRPQNQRLYVPHFESYIGITVDSKQFQFAEQRIKKFRPSAKVDGKQKVRLLCADAAKPHQWDDGLVKEVCWVAGQADEPCVLALDTLYHFSPSRWPIIDYASNCLHATFMAFDICLASRVSFPNKILLRIITSLMGAPWANFVTAEEYRVKLEKVGYKDITIRDISDYVFEPLACFLEDQDRRLRVIGFDLGAFHVAKWMFKWWGTTRVVRGVIVVAKK